MKKLLLIFSVLLLCTNVIGDDENESTKQKELEKKIQLLEKQLELEKHKKQNEKHWVKNMISSVPDIELDDLNLTDDIKQDRKQNKDNVVETLKMNDHLRLKQNIIDEVDNMKTLKGDVSNKYFDLYPDWLKKKERKDKFLNNFYDDTLLTLMYNLILTQITVDLLELRNILYIDDTTDNERKQRWEDARDCIKRDKDIYDEWIENRNISSYERSQGGARKTRRKRKYIQKRKTKHKSRSKNKGKKTIKLRHRRRQTRKRYR